MSASSRTTPPSSTSSSGAGTSSNSATIQQIKKYLRIKDFYELLSVSKTSTEDEMKKNYRKLALKFHPDQCKITGAQDVFKKIATAYVCLSNKQKKFIYDKYGNEEPEQQSQHYRQQYDDSDIDPNDIFNFFFGGGLQQPQRRQHAHQHYEHRENNHNNNQRAGNQQQQNQFAPIMQLLPILLILFFGVVLNLLKEEPLYSMDYSWKYSIKRTTPLIGGTYFVASDFQEIVSKNPGIYKQIQRQIEEEQIRDLRNTCYYQKQVYNQYQHQVSLARNQRDRDAYELRMQRVDMRACTQLDQYGEKINLNQIFPY